MKHLFIKCSKFIDLTSISSISAYCKRLALFFSPVIIPVILYFIWDPFKIIYNYDNYYEDKDYYNSKNRDFVSSAMYIKNCRKYKYDSFILGGSTALFIPPNAWRKYIDSTSSVFSFDASAENIVGIWSKIKFIDENNSPIKNALLVFDTGITFNKFHNKGRAYRKHYTVYPHSKLFFHFESLLSFLDVKYLMAALHIRISNHYYPYMKGILEERHFSSDLITNEIFFKGPMQELKMDSLGYYKKRSNLFYSRSGKYTEFHQQIDEEKIRMLQEIMEIFIKDSTNFRIIISPHYNQISFNSLDLNLIKKIFGEDKVFDFSGINDYTRDISNYYDNNHFKQYIGTAILSKIYSNSAETH